VPERLWSGPARKRPYGSAFAAAATASRGTFGLSPPITTIVTETEALRAFNTVQGSGYGLAKI
jgi:hypothetical protein